MVVAMPRKTSSSVVVSFGGSRSRIRGLGGLPMCGWALEWKGRSEEEEHPEEQKEEEKGPLGRPTFPLSHVVVAS